MSASVIRHESELGWWEMGIGPDDGIVHPHVCLNLRPTMSYGLASPARN